MVGVWGEFVNHKRSLTHRPSSQGWAPECPIHYVDCLFVFCGCGGFLSFLPLQLPKLCSVLYTCTFMYVTYTVPVSHLHCHTIYTHRTDNIHYSLFHPLGEYKKNRKLSSSISSILYTYIGIHKHTLTRSFY